MSDEEIMNLCGHPDAVSPAFREEFLRGWRACERHFNSRPASKYIKHTVGEMDEDMVQRCVICGEIISDYRNAMVPAGQKLPKGFEPGIIYVSIPVSIGKGLTRTEFFQTPPLGAVIVECNLK